MSQVLTPKLSTVDQPSHEMGIASFNLLLEEMNCHKEGVPFTPKTLELETTVIIRESSIRLKN
jgi:LacI family transcriptional regulator